MPRRFLRVLVLAGTLAAASVAAVTAAENQPSAESIRFFETHVRPVLATHCYECHGPDVQESELRLDTLAGILKGGRSGMAVEPGRPDQSLLATAIRYQDADLQMPPDGKLGDGQIADLVRWIKLGAPHPDSGKVKQPVRESIDLDEGRRFWSFQPVADPAPPAVKNAHWPRSPLDHFILARLEQAGLEPAPPADKRTLIRRAAFDLTGLPPTPQEVEAFLADDSPRAYERLIERLLTSPHYGERWGRHWLDVARYADSNGLDENIAHGNAWRYRDWVVASLNADKPYDEFVIEQLAGDLLSSASDAQRRDRLIATGFLSLGPKVLAEVDERKMEMDIVDEQIDTLGRSLMGLTLGCARCHDHKFDPVPTEDYYALAGIFRSTRTMEHFKKIARWWENPVPAPRDRARLEAHRNEVEAQKQQIAALVERANEALRAQRGPDAPLPEKPEEHYPDETKNELKKLRGQLASLEKSAPAMPTAMGVTDRDVVDAHVHVRGSHLTLGEKIPRRFPQVLAGTDQPPLPSSESGRLELARWLVAPDHPLTARVMVNRIWRWHFGRGIVGTPDNFGQLGARPTHPELLDWLASRFVEAGWSIKALHREIMLSATYRMSSRHDPQAAAADPENRLYWRADVRRLEAEVIRDALLAVGGTLDRAVGGSMLHVGNREFIFNHTSKDETRYESNRRSIYLPVIRNHLYDVFSLFDYSDASVINGDRPTTTVAPQALFLMNSPFVADVTRSMARRLLGDSDLADDERVAALYQRAFSRPPRADEIRRALAFVESYQEDLEASGKSDASSEDPQLRAWQALCHVIVQSNEFVYLR